jgi:DNA-binding CsgD family transcriptional regulator
VERLEEMGCAHPGARPGLPRAVEAAAMVGDRENCARFTDRLTRQAGALRTPLTDAHSCAARGQLALLDGDAEQAVADLANATAAYTGCGYRFDAARTGLSLARAWLRCGQRSNARAAAGAARQEFTTAGAPQWVAFADDLLARAQASAPGGSLTGTETQIASLVAAGLLNREIASELFITNSTVEAHLTRIYRKLGLRHRTELTNYIHAKG